LAQFYCNSEETSTSICFMTLILLRKTMAGEHILAGRLNKLITVEFQFQEFRESILCELKVRVWGSIFTGPLARFQGRMGNSDGYTANISMNFSYNKIEFNGSDKNDG